MQIFRKLIIELNNGLFWIAELWQKQKHPERILLFLTAILSIWVFLPFWNEGLPISWDAPAHYLRALVMKNLFLPNFAIDGWSPYWYLGIRQFLFYSPLLFIVIGILHLFTFKVVSLALSFKIMYFLSYFSLPFACYWLMRQLRIAPLPSSMAALSVPAFSAMHGIGIEALFISGLFTQVFSLSIFCLALAFLIRLKHSGGINLLLSVLLLGILSISHLFSYLFCLFVLFLLFLVNIFDHNYVFRLIASFFGSVLLGAFYLAPLFYFYLSGFHGPETGWGPINLILLILQGKYFAPALVNVFALTGLGLTLFQKNKNLTIIALLSILLYLLTIEFGLSKPGYYWFIPIQLFKSRNYAYLAIFMIVLSGNFYQFVYQGLLSLRDKWKRLPKILPSLFILLLILIIVASVLIRLVPLRAMVKVDSDISCPNRQLVISALEWLKVNSPPNTIIAYDNRWEKMSDVELHSFESRINIISDRYTLGGNHLEATRTLNAEVERHLAEWSANKIYDTFKRYNVSYILTWNDDAENNLASRPDLFGAVYDNGFVSIWQLKGHDFRFLANDNVKITQFSFSPENIRWQIKNEEKNNRTVASVAYHPNWQLYIDGAKTSIDETRDHLISFLLQKNDLYNIELKFDKLWWEKILSLISGASFLGLVILIICSVVNEKKLDV